MRAVDYDTHTCTDEVNNAEMQLVHTIVLRILYASNVYFHIFNNCWIPVAKFKDKPLQNMGKYRT